MKVFEVLGTEKLFELLQRLIEKQGFAVNRSVVRGNKPCLVVRGGSAKQARVVEKNGDWETTILSGQGHKLGTFMGETDATISYLKSHLNRKKVEEAKVEDTLAHTFGRIVKKMAASERGLWVYIKQYASPEPEQAKVTHVEELEAGGHLMFRVHIVAIDHKSKKKQKPLVPTWFELNDDDDEKLVIKDLNGKRTLMDKSGVAFRL